MRALPRRPGRPRVGPRDPAERSPPAHAGLLRGEGPRPGPRRTRERPEAPPPARRRRRARRPGGDLARGPALAPALSSRPPPPRRPSPPPPRAPRPGDSGCPRAARARRAAPARGERVRAPDRLGARGARRDPIRLGRRGSPREPCESDSPGACRGGSPPSPCDVDRSSRARAEAGDPADRSGRRDSGALRRPERACRTGGDRPAGERDRPLQQRAARQGDPCPPRPAPGPGGRGRRPRPRPAGAPRARPRLPRDRRTRDRPGNPLPGRPLRLAPIPDRGARRARPRRRELGAMVGREPGGDRSRRPSRPGRPRAVSPFRRPRALLSLLLLAGCRIEWELPPSGELSPVGGPGSGISTASAPAGGKTSYSIRSRGELVVETREEVPFARLGVTTKTASRTEMRAQGIEGPAAVKVLTVEPDGPAARAGIAPGDLLTNVDGTDLLSSEHLREVLRKTVPTGPVPILGRRNGEAFGVDATLEVRREPRRRTEYRTLEHSRET